MKLVEQSAKAEPEYQRRFQATFQSAPVGMAICSLEGVIAEVNPEFGKMLGYSAEELTSANIFLMDPPRCDLGAKPAGVRKNETGMGSKVASPAKFSPAEWIAGQESVSALEKAYQRKDGSAMWGHLTTSLGLGPSGRPAFLVAILSDVTAQKQVEEHLREVEKMELIGRLAGGIAHDFNNLLTGILLYCDLITANLESEKQSEASANSATGEGVFKTEAATELFKHIDEVRMAGEQGAALTHQLLAIARKQAAEPLPIAINDLVLSTTNLLRRLIGRQVELLTVLDPQAGLVLADPGRLRQVLLNLVLNARDAMPNGGSIVLNTRLGTFPADDSAPGDRHENKIRPAVALAVTDNGSGMNESTRAHLFEPFFTTKPPGEGTGLGLTTVRRIVVESGGSISVSSAPGEGTCVEIFLPSLVDAEETLAGVEQSAAVATAAPAPSREQSIASPGTRPAKQNRAEAQPRSVLPRINLVHRNSQASVFRNQKPRGDQHA